MLRRAGLVAVLFVFWLLLSGHYTVFLIAVGLITAVSITALLHYMRTVDRQAQPFEFLVGAATYWPWLACEIRLGCDPNHNRPEIANLACDAQSQGIAEDGRWAGNLRQLDHAHAGYDFSRARRQRNTRPCAAGKRPR